MVISHSFANGELFVLSADQLNKPVSLGSASALKMKFKLKKYSNFNFSIVLNDFTRLLAMLGFSATIIMIFVINLSLLFYFFHFHILKTILEFI